MKPVDDPMGDMSDEHSLLSLAHDAVIVRALTGEIRFWNRGAEEIYGWTAAEVRGRVAHDVLGTSAPTLQKMGQSLRSLGEWAGELAQRRKDGSEVVVASRQISRPGRAGQPAMVLEINRDVTEASRGQARLRGSEERLRLMVERVEHYAIFMMDADGIVVSWNIGAQRMNGYRAEEIIGHHFSSFYPQQDVEAGKPTDELRVAAVVGHVEDEGWRVRKDGSRFWASVVITAVRDAAGTLRGFGKVIRDFTERKRYEEGLQHQARLLDRVRDAVIAADSDLLITGWNAGAELLYGWRAEEVVGRATTAILGTEHPPGRRDEALRVVLNGGEWRGMVVQRHKDGRRLYVEAATVVVLDEATRIVSVNRDIGGRRRALLIEERERIARDLHDSVSQALFSLTLETRALELALKLDGREGNVPVAAGIANIRQLTQGALAEMRSLLLGLRPDALAEHGLVAALGRYCATIGAREGLTVNVTLPSRQTIFEPEVENSLFRLAQEALNNVVKHAAASTVDVRLAGTENGSAGIVLEITDDGVGFDSDRIRAGHLGLTNMSERAAALGGAVEVRSVPGRGTIVRAWLPYDRRAAPP